VVSSILPPGLGGNLSNQTLKALKMTKLPTATPQPRKETILLIAEEVFAQYNFEGASIRLITKRLGVNSAMISYYFGSKEALYLEIFKLRLHEVTEEISRFEAVDLNPVEKLKGYLAAYIKRVAGNQNFHRLLCNELVTLQHPAVIAQISASRQLIYNFLLDTIAKGFHKGYFKKIDEEVLVLNILSLVRSLFTDHLTLRNQLNELPQDDLARRIVGYFMSMLTLENHYQTEKKSHV
jgi:TetR/AcrR family transcriptional regulator